MNDQPTIDEDTHRKVTAHHEAGHAVAYVMRGGSSLRSITLDPDGFGGITWGRSRKDDVGFIAYAGQWAEARYGETAEVLPDGMTADAFLTRTFLESRDDWEGGVFDEDEDEEHCDWQRIMDDLHARAALLAALPTEQRPDFDAPLGVWHRELERVWPAIQAVAARLLAGDVLDDDDVRRLVGAH